MKHMHIHITAALFLYISFSFPDSQSQIIGSFTLSLRVYYTTFPTMSIGF